jgi:DNA-binding NarL/FixJ family response regulator
MLNLNARSMARKSVILAEDHQLVRTGIRTLVESFDAYDVVAEAGDVQQAVAFVGEHRPDLLLLDVTLPDGTGIAALPFVKQCSPRTRVLMLSMYETADLVLAALQAGADGYLPKSSAADELQFALEALMLGRTYLSPTISQGVLDQAMLAQRTPPRPQPDEPAPGDLLTPRQLEILRLVASGRSMKEIAYDLDLSVKTVETHRAQIMERLGIRDLPRLVLYAVRHGLVSPDAC